MKKVWDFLKNFVVIAYILLIIFVTICLLSYNKYKVTVFGKNTFLPIIDEDLEPDYKYGDLLIINRNNLSTVKEGDVIFFYRTVAGITTVNYAKVLKNERVSDTETTFTVDGEYVFSSSYFIGKADTATIVPKVGKVIGILESKWGFLFLGVLPSLIAFLYTVSSVVREFQSDDEDDEDVKKSKKSKKKNKEKTDSKINNVSTEVETDDSKVENEKNIGDSKESNEEKNPIKDINLKEDKEDDLKDNKEPSESNSEDKEKVDNENIENTKSEEIENEKTDKKENDIKDSENEKIEEKDEEAENLENKKEDNSNNSNDKKTMTEEQKKALIQAKINSMTEEEKKALIQAKLNSMTEEQKRALIEAKKKRMEAENNNNK